MSLVSTVAVIGAGPGGLAAAKYLAAEKIFTNITVFEARSSVGGIWCATPHDTLDKNFTIPRTKPTSIPNTPIHRDGRLEIISPVYDFLDTNIPHTLMQYSDKNFPEGAPLFPPHRMVREYLEEYAEEVKDLIRFEFQVLEVVPINGGKWWVKKRNLQTYRESASIFDAVVVASGHYDDPFVPDIKGMKAWDKKFPRSISHSKFYRRPDQFKDKKVIIVGHSSSGVDLVAQISPISKLPLIISEKHNESLPPDLNTTTTSTISLPEISEFILENRSVQFTDGHVETDVDSVIFCTGYMYSFPFLKTLSPPILSDGNRVQGIYQQIFYHPNPTLSFIGLPQFVIPFPVSEGQAAVIARILAGRLSLPSQSHMQAWEAEYLAHAGDGKDFHILRYPLDASYINMLHDRCAFALTRNGLENEGRGKMPPSWGEVQKWVRERFPFIRAASLSLGTDKHKIKTLEELGFNFEEWKKENDCVSEDRKADG